MALTSLGEAAVHVTSDMSRFDQGVKSGAQKAFTALTATATKAGADSGKGYTDGVKLGLGGTTAALVKVKQEVGNATNAWNVATKQQQDAISKVTIATAQAEMVTEKYGAESNQARIANEKLAMAQRDAAAATDNVRDKQTALIGAQNKLRDASKEVGEAQRNAADETARTASQGERGAQQYQSAWGRLASGLKGILPAGIREAGAGATVAAAGEGEESSGRWLDRWRRVQPKVEDSMGEGVADGGEDAIRLAQDYGGRAGTSFGAMFGANLLAELGSKAIMGVLSKITGAVRGAFSAGFTRLTNIENAETKLLSVGANVEESMASVNEAVDGTRFALSDAADMAAVLSASGVDAGEEMTRWLRLTANAAEFNNAEFSDMQRVLQRVVQTGKVTGETFDQLPIAASALADSLGVSQEEVRKLASEGKISAEQLADALEGTLGSAAENAGKTFGAMAANIRTAMGASAANLIAPVLEAMKPIMAAFLPLVKMFRDNVAKPLGESFGTWLQPRAEAFAAALERLPQLFTAIKEAFVGPELGAEMAAGGLEALGPASPFVQGLEKASSFVKTAVDGIRDVFGGFLFGLTDGLGTASGIIGPLLQMLTGPLGLLRSALMDVAGSFDLGAGAKAFGEMLQPILGSVIELYDALSSQLAGVLAEIIPLIANLVTDLFPILGQVIKTVVPVIVELSSVVLELAAELIRQLVPVFVQLVKSVIPPLVDLIQQLVPVVLEVVKAVVPLVSTLAQALIPVVVAVVEAVVPLVSMLVKNLAPIIVNLVKTVLPPLVGVLQMVAEVVKVVVVPILTTLVRFLGAVLGRAFEALMPIIRTVFGFIQRTIANVMKYVQGILKTVTSLIKGDWDGVWDGIKMVFGAVWDQIKNIASTAFDFLKNLFTKWSAPALISNHWETIKGFFSGAWTWIKNVFANLWNGVQGVLMAPVDLAKAAINKVFDAATGVRAIFNSVKDWVTTTFKRSWDAIQTTLMAPVQWARDKISDLFGSGGYTGLTGIFNRIRDWVKTTFKNSWDMITGLLSSPIDGAVNAIKGAWDKIKGIMQRPVNWVIDNVLNPFLKAIKSLLSAVGLGGLAGKLKLVPTLGGTLASMGAGGASFATGGWTGPGPRLKPAGVVHADEHVWTKAEMRRFPGGHRAMAQWRRDVLAGRADAHLPGYAGGGQVAPVPGRGRRHTSGYPWATWAGDYPVPMGTPIKSWKDGIVALVRHLTTSYGKHVRVNHTDGTSSLYAHMSRILVSLGQRVSAGHTLGLVGSTGNSTGPHLHFETMGGPFAGGMSGSASSSSTFDIGKRIRDAAAGFISKKVSGAGVFGDFLNAIPGKLLDGIVSRATSLFTTSLAGSGTFVGGGVERWRPTVLQALARVGQPSSLADITLRRMNQESSGNPRAINTWDINAKNGTPSKGLMQVIDPTFRAYRDRGLPNDIWDPMANIVASMKYALGRYGSLSSAYNRAGGYLGGGPVTASGPAWLSEDNRMELVVGKQLRALRRGSYVFNNRDTADILGGGRRGSVTNNYNVTVETDLSRIRTLQDLIEFLQNYELEAHRS